MPLHAATKTLLLVTGIFLASCDQPRNFSTFRDQTFEALMVSFNSLGPAGLATADLQPQTGVDSATFDRWIWALKYAGYVGVADKTELWIITPPGIAKYEATLQDRDLQWQTFMYGAVSFLLGILATPLGQWLSAWFLSRWPALPSTAKKG